MNPEEQRIAIAKTCGFKIQSSALQAPDYLNDLNAMHEAEKVLTTNDQVSNYENRLMEICGGYRRSLHSTAAQRAEAFLRTKGLWKD